MSFDGIVTRAVTHELNQTLTTGRVMKIYQPTDTELVFTIRAQRKNHSLLLSAHPSYARFHLTEDNYHNPKEPPMLCMLLRKHLVGGFIISIEQVEMERIVKFHIKSRNELGDETTKTLIMEVMGKHSNIILIDQEKGHILDSIKHLPPSQNRHRTVMPGQLYKLPPEQGKTNPVDLEPEEFVKKLDFNAGKMDRQILGILMGCSPLITKEIAHEAFLGSKNTYESVYRTFRERLSFHDYAPRIYHGDKEIFYVLPLDTAGDSFTTFRTVSSMLDAYYSGKAERDRVKQQAGDLHRLLKNERDKNIRKIKKHEETLRKAENADKYQREGELLTAHLHLVQHGDETVEVIDYYDPDQKTIMINLNPNKSPSENAQALFQQYQKMKKSKQVVQEEIKKARGEIDYLDQLLQQVESAREQDIEEIREELREEGYLKKKRQQSKRKNKANKPEPDKFLSSDGTPIYVGRNNKQNEYLTNRLAGKNDTWLHTKDIPGSHVVIKSTEPTEDTLLEAAQLAANYSKSQHSSSVPVDYTLIRHVKKPSGAKPGFVIYDHQQTLFVTPDASIVKQLKENSHQGKGTDS
ncbi:Rqc2 family fibronectin-binding protein [Thalassobacillus pellis]|uniref:Rqc2 family fibronectin-binding protein n=1 Tax=Thalassobacillus pellis TaxID=748008 RepID=UPI00195FB8EC|nr:NFACT RNA binding domain-containing protein [Thalassobacillus pellis]MBM7552819.1 putative ribosome quality control (RQC) complex YloA/Tae2 family protein [Thalassobacillus pellis]